MTYGERLGPAICCRSRGTAFLNCSLTTDRFDDMTDLERYNALLEGYEQGIYTDREVVGQAFDMLSKSNDREALWHGLRPAHREELGQFLTNYDEAAPPQLPHEYWRRVKEDTIALKRWFASR